MDTGPSCRRVSWASDNRMMMMQMGIRTAGRADIVRVCERAKVGARSSTRLPYACK